MTAWNYHPTLSLIYFIILVHGPKTTLQRAMWLMWNLGFYIFLYIFYSKEIMISISVMKYGRAAMTKWQIIGTDGFLIAKWNVPVYHISHSLSYNAKSCICIYYWFSSTLILDCVVLEINWCIHCRDWTRWAMHISKPQPFVCCVQLWGFTLKCLNNHTAWLNYWNAQLFSVKAINSCWLGQHLAHWLHWQFMFHSTVLK